MKKDHRWEMKEGQHRRQRDRRQRLTREDFLKAAQVDLIAACLAAVANCVPLAQIQLWELAL